MDPGNGALGHRTWPAEGASWHWLLDATTADEDIWALEKKIVHVFLRHNKLWNFLSLNIELILVNKSNCKESRHYRDSIDKILGLTLVEQKIQEMT